MEGGTEPRPTRDAQNWTFPEFVAELRMFDVDVTPSADASTSTDDAGIDAVGLLKLSALLDSLTGTAPEELHDSLETLGDWHYYLATRAGHIIPDAP